MRRRYGSAVLTAVVVIASVASALAQRGGGIFLPRSSEVNPPYNGQFTFTRLTYNTGQGGGSGFGFGRRGMSSAWNHDYPQADMHLPLIIDALTAVRPNLHVSNVLSLEDPEIFRNPVLYMWEPGYWSTTDAEAENLRNYMLKGGFVIFDDFEAEQWDNFEAQFRRALPDAEFVELDASHPLFHSFFELDRLNVPHPTVPVKPVYYAVYEHNDRTRRMMALVNYNSDIAEYWEWSGQGLFPVDTTNDAYKLGVNYMIYAFTH